LKKNGVLNKDISEVVASMGHTDMIMICDAGLPFPSGVRRIDLAITKGVPGFIQTTEVIADELKIDHVIVADELSTVSPHILMELRRIFNNVEIESIPHEKLKELSQKTKAIIRTGEFTPYANVILVSGVLF